MNSTNLDSVLKYLPLKEGQKEKPLEEDSVLEAKVEESESVEKTEEPAPVKYLPFDLSEFAYKAANDNAIYSFKSFVEEEEEYMITSPKNDTYDAELPIDEEAKEDLHKSKYEFITSAVNVDYEKKKKLATWILFHPADFAFIESFHGLSREVNY